MPSYVRQIKCETEYDGQHVVAKVRPLLFTDALRLRDVATAEDATLLYTELLPSYIIEMSALLDADGMIVPLDEALKSTFYAQLFATIMNIHVTAASVPNPPLPAAAPAG